MSDNNMICGRTYEVRTAGLVHPKSTARGRNRVIVDGINHPKGQPIRFKSTAHAERHIRNMRLERRP